MVKRVAEPSDRSLSVPERHGAVVLGTLTLALLAVRSVGTRSAVFAAGPLGVLSGFAVLLVGSR